VYWSMSGIVRVLILYTRTLMKNRRHIAWLVALSLLLTSASVAHAAHYLLGKSSVDELEIRWGGSTTYSTQWTAAIATWNARGGVNIAPDTL
jgi:hypothetical protein